MRKRIYCAYPSRMKKSKKKITASKDEGKYKILTWEEICDKLGYEYDEDMRKADQETEEDLKSNYGLKLLGYAVKKENLDLLDPDTDPDTQESITPYYVEDESGRRFTCQYSRGVLRDAETGEFI